MLEIVTKMYGAVDEVKGLFAVRTRFYHFHNIPFLPIGSFLVLNNGESYPIGFYPKSIVTAYFRFCCFGAFIFGLVGAFLFNSLAAYVALSVFAIFFFCLSYLLKGWGTATYDRARKLIVRAGLGPDIETHLEYRFGYLTEQEFLDSNVRSLETKGEQLEKKLGFNPIYYLGGFFVLLAIFSFSYKPVKAYLKSFNDAAAENAAFADIPDDLQTVDQCVACLSENDDERIALACKKLTDPEVFDKAKVDEVCDALMDLTGRAGTNEKAGYEALEIWSEPGCFTELKERLSESPKLRIMVGRVFVASDSPEVAPFLHPSLKGGFDIVQKFRQLGPDTAEDLLAGVCSWRQAGSESKAARLLKAWEVKETRVVEQVFLELESKSFEQRVAALRLLGIFAPDVPMEEKAKLARVAQDVIKDSAAHRDATEVAWKALGELKYEPSYPLLTAALLDSQPGTIEAVRAVGAGVEREIHQQLKARQLGDNPPRDAVVALSHIGGEETLAWLKGLSSKPEKEIRALELRLRYSSSRSDAKEE